MTENDIVLIRDTTNGQVQRVRLAKVEMLLLGWQIDRFQYSAGDRWYSFTGPTSKLMRGEIEARLAELKAEAAKEDAQ